MRSTKHLHATSPWKGGRVRKEKKSFSRIVEDRLGKRKGGYRKGKGRCYSEMWRNIRAGKRKEKEMSWIKGLKRGLFSNYRDGSSGARIPLEERLLGQEKKNGTMHFLLRIKDA